MTNLARRHFLKISAGAISVIRVAGSCHALTLLRVTR